MRPPVDPSLPAASLADEARVLGALAWPAVLSQLGWMMLGVVDTAMVGDLGGSALASVSLGNLVSWSSMIVAYGTLIGIEPMLSQANGAGDTRERSRAASLGFAIALAGAVPVMAVHFATGPILAGLAQPPDVIPGAARYAAIVALGIPPLMIWSFGRQVLQAQGVMHAATVGIIAANFLNVAANQALIFGWGPVPAMGTDGAAWATTLSRFFLLVSLLPWLWRDLVDAWEAREIVRDLAAWRAAINLGGPVGLQMGSEVWAFHGATILMGWISETAVAAHAVSLTLCSVSFMLPMGISSAISTRVGNLLGAGLPWARPAWTGIGMGGAIMLFSGAMYAMFPGPLSGLFTDDPEVLAVAVTLLPLAAAFQVFDGTQVCAFAALRGAGDSRLPGIANIVGYWLIGLPFGWWASERGGYGARGVWLGLALGLAIVALLLVARLRVITLRGGRRLAAPGG